LNVSTLQASWVNWAVFKAEAHSMPLPLTAKSDGENPSPFLTSIRASWNSKRRKLLTWPYSAVTCNDVCEAKNLNWQLQVYRFEKITIYSKPFPRPTGNIGVS
jgi:hypothetical protein